MADGEAAANGAKAPIGVSGSAERRFRFFVVGLASLAALLPLALALFVAREAASALFTVPIHAWTDRAGWYPTQGRFDLVAMTAASLTVSAGALVLALPLGLGVALVCHVHRAATLGRALRRLLTVLTSLPSVVYGFWGLVTLVPWIGALHPPGPSLLAAALVLAVMVLPTLSLLSAESLEVSAREHTHAAAALGLAPWTIVRRLTLPAARRGLAAGALLAFGRAIGETMVVMMVAGNVVQLPHSVFDPVRTLTANIALEMGYALGVHRSALFVNGLVLLALVGLLVWLARRVCSQRPERDGVRGPRATSGIPHRSFPSERGAPA